MIFINFLSNISQGRPDDTFAIFKVLIENVPIVDQTILKGYN
jgi:hypothetical protein